MKPLPPSTLYPFSFIRFLIILSICLENLPLVARVSLFRWGDSGVSKLGWDISYLNRAERKN